MDLLSYADRAVTLVNTASPLCGVDRLRTVDDVCDLLVPYPRWRSIATRADIAPLRAGRDVLREIFEAGSGRGAEERAVALLNAMLDAHPIHPQVTDHDGWPLHLHLAESAPAAADGFLATAAFGTAVAATRLGLSRFGVCRSTTCSSVFLDSSTNSSRRYCGERCATRMNVAAYRARRRASAAVRT